MFPLGTLKAPLFIGVAVEVDFNTFPFVDLTTRHVVNNTSVTQVSNKAFFNNPDDNSLARLEIVNQLQDFHLQTDFDVTFTANVQTFANKGEQLFFSLLDGLNATTVDCYVTGTGRLITYFYPVSTGLLSTEGFVTAGVDFDYKLERRGSTVKMYFNSVEIATATIANFDNKSLKLNLGARADYLGYGLYGTMDNFKFESF